MEPSEKLNITFAGVKMRSPLGVGANAYPMGQWLDVTPEMHAEQLLRHATEGGAGYIEANCTWTPPEELAKRPKMEYPAKFSPVRVMKVDGMDGVYLFNTYFGHNIDIVMSYDIRSRIIEILRKSVPEGVAIIASHGLKYTKPTPEANVLSVKKVEELGVDLLELPISCMYGLGLEGAVEAYLEQKKDEYPNLEEIVRQIVKAVKIPVGVKFSPGELGYPRVLRLIRRLRDAGAKYVQISNVPHAIAPPDIYNRGKGCYPLADGNPFMGLSGTPLRAECYRDVAGIAKFAPGIEIAAAGGLDIPEHAVEVMMLGAGNVQMLTGLLFHGRSLLRRTTQFIEKFLDEQGYKSVGELVGLAQQHIKGIDKVALVNAVAEVDQAKCTGCGVCWDGICLAMEEREDKSAQVNHDLCYGCALCVSTCPEQAIKLIPR